MAIKFLTILAMAAGTLAVYQTASAHCPLCTAGAGVAAIGAVWLGVKVMVVAIFLGALGMAMGMWFSRWLREKLRRQFVRGQDFLLGVLSLVLTIVPLRPFFPDLSSIYISWGGEYGSLFNRTYLIDRLWIGAIIGAVVMLAGPYISQGIQKIRGGKMIPYQGIAITFGLLLIIGVILQLTI